MHSHRSKLLLLILYIILNLLIGQAIFADDASISIVNPTTQAPVTTTIHVRWEDGSLYLKDYDSLIIWNSTEEKHSAEANFNYSTFIYHKNLKDVAGLLNYILAEFQRYPASILKGKIEKVFMVETLINDGRDVLGIADTNKIAVKFRDGVFNFNTTLHHEIQHVFQFQYNFAFNMVYWDSCNDASFDYGWSSCGFYKENRLSTSYFYYSRLNCMTLAF